LAYDPIFSDAIIFASLLALLSIGLTLTYLTTRVPNFAHASFATMENSTMENFLISSGGNSGESFLLAPLKSKWKNDEKKIIDDSIEIMEMVSLVEQKDTPSKNLSGGQQKLLELGRAMMSGAKMILMDEPIAGVNPTLAHEIFNKISKICKTQKITFLIVEHRLDIALQYADHVFAMDRGKIIAEGNSDEVIKHPKVVESYLGE